MILDDVYHLPSRESTFDAVLSSGFLEHSKESLKIIQGIVIMVTYQMTKIVTKNLESTNEN